MRGEAREYIVCSVASERYGIAIETVERIINVPPVTPLPASPDGIDGMISYEGAVIRVLDFRRVTALPTCEEELAETFDALRRETREWIEGVSQAVIEGSPFEGERDPRRCGLGRWIDRFTPRDEHIAALHRELKRRHGRLHLLGEALLEQRRKDPRGAIEALQGEINDCYGETAAALEELIVLKRRIADSMQKLLVYRGHGAPFAIKVDRIDDIRSVEELSIRPGDRPLPEGVAIAGTADLDGIPVTIIASVHLPKSEEG